MTVKLINVPCLGRCNKHQQLTTIFQNQNQTSQIPCIRKQFEETAKCDLLTSLVKEQLKHPVKTLELIIKYYPLRVQLVAQNLERANKMQAQV